MNETKNFTYFINKTEIDALTSDEILSIIQLRYIIYGWICLPISIIGLVLNSFTIIVLLHSRMRNFSTNIYLTALSIANIVCLINYIFLYSLRYLISYSNFKLQALNSQTETQYSITGIKYESFLSMILWAWSPIFNTFQLFAIYLTCSVTVDRWIYLLFPFKADRLCTKRRTMIVILCILLFCVLFNLPRWFEVTYIKYYDDVTNLTIYQAGPTSFGTNPLVKTILNYYVYIIHVYGIPFFVLLVVNIGIIQKLIVTKERKTLLLGYNRKIVKNNKNGKNCKSSSSEIIATENDKSTTSTPLVSIKTTCLPIPTSKIDPKITFMVLAVVIAFFICQFPYLIFTIITVKHENKFVYVLKLVSDLLATVSCSVNFLIYCLFGQKFRETANEILFSKSFLRSKSKNVITSFSVKKQTPLKKHNSEDI